MIEGSLRSQLAWGSVRERKSLDTSISWNVPREDHNAPLQLQQAIEDDQTLPQQKHQLVGLGLDHSRGWSRKSMF